MAEHKNLDENFDLDIEILKKLSVDGRISLRRLARDLEEMEEKGIIKDYGIHIDYEELGYKIIALIEITVSKGKMLEVENIIAQNPNVFAVYDITGTYDALILARFKKRAKLSEMIKNVIHASPYVERSNTHIVLNVIKEKGSFAELINNE